jgi:hypothetical protein
MACTLVAALLCVPTPLQTVQVTYTIRLQAKPLKAVENRLNHTYSLHPAANTLYTNIMCMAPCLQLSRQVLA